MSQQQQKQQQAVCLAPFRQQQSGHSALQQLANLSMCGACKGSKGRSTGNRQTFCWPCPAFRWQVLVYRLELLLCFVALWLEAALLATAVQGSRAAAFSTRLCIISAVLAQSRLLMCVHQLSNCSVALRAAPGLHCVRPCIKGCWWLQTLTWAAGLECSKECLRRGSFCWCGC
jgi:hypothetical protein